MRALRRQSRVRDVVEEIFNNQQHKNLKAKPKLSQIEAKTEPKLSRKLSQIEAKTEPKLSRKLSRKLSQIEAKTEPKLSQIEAETEPKLSQEQNKTEPNRKSQYNHKSLYTITGLQLNILLYINKICTTSRTRQSPPITTKNIVNACKSTISAVRKAIQRLERKEVLYRIDFKRGQGGWTIYEIDKDIFQDIITYENSRTINGIEAETEPKLSQIEAKTEPKLSQIEAETEPKTEPKTEPSSPSSSTNITNINTTTGLDENYSQVQIPKILKENNFSVNIIKQVQDRGYLSVDALQSSLDAFAFDVTTNKVLEKKKVNNAVAYFMGIVKNKTPYAAPSNFESDEDKAFKEQEIRLQAIKQKRLEREKMIEELAFEEWLDGLTTSEKTKLAPPVSAKNGVGSFIHNSQLRGVWNKQQEELLKKN